MQIAKVYEVQSGDSLSVIAHNMLGDMSRWPELAALNNLKEPYTIYPGQQLTLPNAPASSVTTTAAAQVVKPSNKTLKIVIGSAIGIGVGVLIARALRKGKKKK